MSESSYTRAALLEVALNNVPPLIRRSLLHNSGFRDEYGLKTDAVIALSDSVTSFQRSNLFRAVRDVLGGTPSVTLTDVNGTEWRLEADTAHGPGGLVVACGEQRVLLPDFSTLSTDRSTRLKALRDAALQVNLPKDAQDKWRVLLGSRCLEDDEVDEFMCDIRDTPVYLAQSIRAEIAAGRSSILSLVPSSRRYYERLVGIYNNSKSIGDYAATEGRRFMQQLTEWKPYDGFLLSLYLSSHADLTSEISLRRLDTDGLARAYNFIDNRGDRLSQLGAIEVGFRVFPERPEIDDIVLSLVQVIRDDDAEGPKSEMKLFAALFVLVDGELSRTRLLHMTPPFYRRLASLAHAALIHRQIVQCGIDYEPICEWALANRGEQYYMQTLADMRSEPRWNPHLGSAVQMKADFFGRMILCAGQFAKNIHSHALQKLVLSDGPGSLHGLSLFPHPYFPGPLEGTGNCPNDLPDDLARFIEVNLDTEEIEPASVIALVNSALIFRIDSGQAALAAKALRLANYRLAKVENQFQLVGILKGLATVAAVTRSSGLASELRILVRRYRHDPQFGFSIEDTLEICLVASACCDELDQWRDFSGDWLTELAFDKFEGDEGAVLHSHIRSLLHAVPELWVSAGRAEAALMAYCAR